MDEPTVGNVDGLEYWRHGMTHIPDASQTRTIIQCGGCEERYVITTGEEGRTAIDHCLQCIERQRACVGGMVGTVPGRA